MNILIYTYIYTPSGNEVKAEYRSSWKSARAAQCFLKVSSGDVPLTLELSLYDAQRFYLSLGPRTCLPSPLVPKINNDFFNPSEILFGFMEGNPQNLILGTISSSRKNKAYDFAAKNRSKRCFLCFFNECTPTLDSKTVIFISCDVRVKPSLQMIQTKDFWNFHEPHHPNSSRRLALIYTVIKTDNMCIHIYLMYIIYVIYIHTNEYL